MAIGTESTTMASPSTSPSVRFLGLLQQPQLDLNDNSTVELDEGDVIWSTEDTDSRSSSSSTHSTSPTARFRPHRPHRSLSSYGLSAALSDDHHYLVRRKSTLNPSLSSLSATSAARMVPPVIRSENPNLSSGASGRFPQSAPVNVPAWPNKKMGQFGNLDRLDELDAEMEEEEEMVPPHIIVARSHVTFSVFEGVGRTLKGRDLRRVRNAVFQKTGFID